MKSYLVVTLLSLPVFLFSPHLSSAQTSTSTPPDTQAAVISAITTSLVPPSGMKIEWMTDELATYTFEYGTSQSYGSTTTMLSEPSLGGQTLLTSLSHDTTYYYCIHATDTSTSGNASNSCDSFTTAPAPDTTGSIISSVANEFLVSTSTKIVWITDESAYSRLRFGKTEDLGLTTSLEINAVLSHEVVLTELSANTKYYYCIEATDLSGNKSDSCGHTFVTAVEAVVGDIVPPIVSLLTTSEITQTSARISWTTDESTKVQVQYGLTTDYTTLSSLSRDYSRTHTANLYRLAPGTLYHYRVRSTDRVGNISISNDETFTTLAPSLPAPSYVDGASESGAVRTEQIRNYRNQSNELRQKISDLASTAEVSVVIPVLFGITRSNISPNFGDPRSGGRTHEGEDIMAVKGTPIVSPTKAVVLRVVVGPTEGNAVYTANPGGETFVYMHLDRYGEGVVPGKVLERGDLIGYVGNTGNASGGAAHLHFEIHNSGNPVDPYPRLTGEFSLSEKITYLAKILTQSSDPVALSNLLVINFRSTFTSALSAGVSLPQHVSNALATIVASAQITNSNSSAEVIILQKYLIAVNTGPAATRLATAGPTGYFGPLTLAALIEFQKSAAISPAAGFYGPITRAYIGSHPLGTSQPLEPTNPKDNETSLTLTRDLHLGMTGEDVRLLQKFLNINGYAVAQTGLGSVGNETTYFGSLTLAAVTRFQIVKGIQPAAGYVGPLTRKALASVSTN